MEATPSDILYDMGIRTFVGSRDMPQNHHISFNLLDKSLSNAKSERERQTAQYYVNMVSQFQLMQDLGHGKVKPEISATLRAELE